MLAKTEVMSLINEVVANSKENNFGSMELFDEPMWEMPLIGFAAGDDPYFAQFKKDIGDFYWLPNEAYKLKFKDANVENAELTVISLAFAQTQNTKNDQKLEKQMACERWYRTRGEWENMIGKISEDIVEGLKEKGLDAVSIDEVKEFARHRSEKFGIASNWSHRHTAFIAGLGTFGLSDGLITENGKAMRFTSIIVKANFKPTKRPYVHYKDYCLFYKNGTCGACIGRCPVNAITKDGHDKDVCSAYLNKIKNEIGPDYVRNSHYISACGLCQTKIPCQDKIPVIEAK